MEQSAAVPQSPEARMMAFLGADEEPRAESIAAEADAEEGLLDDGTENQQSDAELADAAENEATEEDTQEQKESRVLKLKHDGVEIEKPEDEVIALAQQGFDYNVKMQKLNEDKRQVESHVMAIKAQEHAFQAQVQVHSALINEISEVTAIDKQLAQFQNVNWQALSDSDPVEAQKLFFTYNQLQTQKTQKVAEIGRKQQEFQYIQQQNLSNQLAIGKERLAKDLPGWGPEMAQTLIKAGREYGFNDNELGTLTDPRTVKLLHDAAKWREFQASKSAADKKVSAASPTVKPGAKDTKNAVNSSIKANREALRKTGKSDYAAKLIERML